MLCYHRSVKQFIKQPNTVRLIVSSPIDRILFKTRIYIYIERPILSFRNPCYSRTTTGCIISLSSSTFARAGGNRLNRLKSHLFVGSASNRGQANRWIVCQMGIGRTESLNVCNDSNSNAPLGIHILFMRLSAEYERGVGEGIEGRPRFERFRCPPSRNKDRKGRGRSLSCKTASLPPYHQSIPETFSLGGQQWEWRHVMRETSIHPTLFF